jgi:hypothetical protein
VTSSKKQEARRRETGVVEDNARFFYSMEGVAGRVVAGCDSGVRGRVVGWEVEGCSGVMGVASGSWLRLGTTWVPLWVERGRRTASMRRMRGRWGPEAPLVRW